MAHVQFNAFFKDLVLLIKRECPTDRTTTAMKKQFKLFNNASDRYVKAFCAGGGHAQDVDAWWDGAPAAEEAGAAAGAWNPVPGVSATYLKARITDDAKRTLVKGLVSGMVLFASMFDDDSDAGVRAAVCKSILDADGDMPTQVIDDDVHKLIRAVSAATLSKNVTDAIAADAIVQEDSQCLIKLAREISNDIDVGALMAGGGAAPGGGESLAGMISVIQEKVHKKLMSGDVDSERLCAEARRALGI